MMSKKYNDLNFGMINRFKIRCTVYISIIQNNVIKHLKEQDLNA